MARRGEAVAADLERVEHRLGHALQVEEVGVALGAGPAGRRRTQS